MLNLGIDKKSFRSEFFEKRPLFLKSGALDFEFKMSDIDSFLYSVDARAPYVRLFQNGQVAEAEYIDEAIEIGITRPRISRKKLYQYMSEGATLVLNRMEIRSIQIKRLCLEIGRFLGEQTVANGYLAFGGDGTFGKHWDTHDVFVVQLIGRKRWKIFPPTFELPISSQTSKNFKDDCPADPCFDQVIEPGDILYVPRGWWHHAIPIEGEPTFHVAIGVHVPTVLDYLIWACANVLPKHITFRRSIDLQENSPDIINAALDEIGTLLKSQNTTDTFRQRAMAKDTAVAGFNFNPLFPQSDGYLDDELILVPRSTYPLNTERVSAALNTLSVPMELSTVLIRRVWVEGGAPIGTIRQDVNGSENVDDVIRLLLRGDLIDIA